ncbi:hypothetical protein GGQ85_001030 [Nitrobacter vulgaris]|nr:hypothetical protein [Nitrobacter vulgaris]
MRDFFTRRTRTNFEFAGSGVFSILLVYADGWYFALWFGSYLLFRAVSEFLAYRGRAQGKKNNRAISHMVRSERRRRAARVGRLSTTRIDNFRSRAGNH